MAEVGAKRMTHLERILGVYPFLYTLGYRANRGWLSAAGARDRGAFLVTYPETIALALLARHTGLLDIARSTAGFVVLLVILVGSSEVIHRFNHRLLVTRGLGTRFAAQFHRIALADKLWMAFYGVLFIVLCFVPMIGFPIGR